MFSKLFFQGENRRLGRAAAGKRAFRRRWSVNALASAADLQKLPFIGICNRLSCGNLYKDVDQFRKSERGIASGSAQCGAFCDCRRVFFQLSNCHQSASRPERLGYNLYGRDDLKTTYNAYRMLTRHVQHAKVFIDDLLKNSELIDKNLQTRGGGSDRPAAAAASKRGHICLKTATSALIL